MVRMWMLVGFQLVVDCLHLFFQLCHRFFECLNALAVIRMLVAVVGLGHGSSLDCFEVA